MMKNEDGEITTVEPSIELDPAHRRMATMLSDSGVDVEELLTDKLQKPVEATLYDAMQSVKYDTDSQQ